MNVSVIIPAYNAAGTIAEAIESVLAQTHSAWEMVVVDDGSTDATAKIARNFSRLDPRIRVVRQPNGGESAARNTGIGKAQNDWLLFLDADDWIAPTHLESLTRELRSNPELDAVICGSVRVALDGTQISDNYMPPPGDLFPTLARRAAFPVHACVVRKSLVEAVGKLDTSLKKSPDWDLWQRIARTGARFGTVSEVLAYYRMLPNSSSLGAEQLFRDGLRVLRQGHGPDPRVPNPHPDYTNGLQNHAVESQEFYLLCWSAGLMLGLGQDPRCLLEQVRDDHYGKLFPDAVAKCIFDSAMLPNCKSNAAWEVFWPTLSVPLEEFLAAVEIQSQTPDLAKNALLELKKLTLSHSPVWRPVIELQEQRIAEQQAQIGSQEQRIGEQRIQIDSLDQYRARLEAERERLQHEADRSNSEKLSLQSELGRLRQRGATLEIEANRSQGEVERLNFERTALESKLRQNERFTQLTEFRLAALHTRKWVRLGLGLGLLKPADFHVTEAVESTAEGVESRWQLRLADGCSAKLMLVPGQPYCVRVAIGLVQPQTSWNIQLNQNQFSLKERERYLLRFQARADRPRRIGVGVAKAQEPWSNLGFYEEIRLTRRWQDFEKEFVASEDESSGRIHFDLGSSIISVEVCGVYLNSTKTSEAEEL